AGGPARGISRRNAVPAAAVCADAGGGEAFRIRPAFFFEPRKSCGRTAGRAGAAYPHWRLDDCAAGSSAGIVPGRAQKIFGVEVVVARGLSEPVRGMAATG